MWRRRVFAKRTRNFTGNARDDGKPCPGATPRNHICADAISHKHICSCSNNHCSAHGADFDAAGHFRSVFDTARHFRSVFAHNNAGTCYAFRNASLVAGVMKPWSDPRACKPCNSQRKNNNRVLKT